MKSMVIGGIILIIALMAGTYFVAGDAFISDDYINALTFLGAAAIITISTFVEIGREDIVKGYKEGLEKEESEIGKEVLCQLIENAEICSNESKPICQDTGMAIVFVEIGREVYIEGNLEEAVNEGVLS